MPDNAVVVAPAIEGSELSPRVVQIRDHLRRSDEHRWEAARLIVAELDDGKSQRSLAGEIGISQSHVSRMARVWQKHGESYMTHSLDRTFSDIENEIARKPKAAAMATAPSAALKPVPAPVPPQPAKGGPGRRPSSA